MHSSTGFQNPSLMGSSTGFKKRNLLRPPSGILSKKQEFLRSIDINQSEPLIATFLRGEVAAIEEQINLLDKDRRLRQAEGGLQKSYVTAFRKWLRENQSLSEKEDDDLKILKHMGVDNYEAGFRKLWKVVGHLDLAVTKITELQVIHFLLYDEMFEEIGKDTQRTSGLLSQICNNSYSAGSFQITQILLDRFKDVYAACRKGSSSSKLREETKAEDRKNREETNELITQLKAQNAKLTSMLEQLSKQREQEKAAIQKQKEPNSLEKEKTNSSATSSTAALKEIQQKYQEQIRYLNSEKTNADFQASQLKARISSLETQLKAAKEQAPISSLPPAKSGSYEEALMEEMEKMKKGFEKKIALITEEFTARQREIRKKEIQYKSENQKIKWQKSLLLKKFQLIGK